MIFLQTSEYNSTLNLNTIVKNLFNLKVVKPTLQCTHFDMIEQYCLPQKLVKKVF